MRLLPAALRMLCLCAALAGPAAAQTLPDPTGEVILEATGQITATNAPDAALFDLAMLTELKPTQITTSTIWSDGVHTFTGVSLHDLVQHLGISGGTLRMTAINDYMIEVPLSDAIEGGPIIAYAMDGNPMSVRDKGPLWLIYPFDTDTRYQSEVYYSRSIWQLNRIEATN